MEENPRFDSVVSRYFSGPHPLSLVDVASRAGSESPTGTRSASDLCSLTGNFGIMHKTIRRRSRSLVL